MPTNVLDKTNTQSNIRRGPKFFSLALTGDGTKESTQPRAGVITKDIYPGFPKRIQDEPATEEEDAELNEANNELNFSESGSRINKDFVIPVNPIPRRVWDSGIYELPLPDKAVFKLADISYQGGWNGRTTANFDVLVTLEPHAIKWNDTKAGTHTRHNNVKVSYQLFLWCVPKGNTLENAIVSTRSRKTLNYGPDGSRWKGSVDPDDMFENLGTHPTVSWTFTQRPAALLKALQLEIFNEAKMRKNGYNTTKINYVIDPNALDDWLSNYDLYAHLNERARQWRDCLGSIGEIVAKNYANDLRMGKLYKRMVAADLSRLVDYFDNYRVDFDQYQEFYDAIAAKIQDKDLLRRMASNNLELLMSDTVQGVSEVSDKLPSVKRQAGIVADPFYSRQQKAAIESESPLILVQSGAGSGKSSCIMGRYDYMRRAGVPTEDILFISFTNAAKDNLLERNPEVNSMTIASMRNAIYQYNYPAQQVTLSTQTLLNRLSDEKIQKSLNSDEKKVLDQLREHLRPLEVNKNSGKNGDLAKLNEFVSQNFDTVIKILDMAEMTTLDLQSVICYQKIDELAEPEDLCPKHLIVDEVQDHSIFDFIYTMKYVTKHQTSLFMVGDAAQCIYDFRNADPKAIRALEDSGLFDIRILDTNYRSCQEILDYANVGLSGIQDGEKLHGIRLSSNDRRVDDPVTPESFKEKVQIRPAHIDDTRKFADTLEAIVRNDAQPWIAEKLAKGEQVCFLTYERKNVRQIKEALEQEFPGEAVMSLVPTVQFKDNTLTNYLAGRGGRQLRFLEKRGIAANIATLITNDLAFYVDGDFEKNQAAALESVKEWQETQGPRIDEWCNQFETGEISDDEFYERVKKSMFETEIEITARNSELIAKANQEQKKQAEDTKCSLIVSTIHSAKGLEFDNVILGFLEKKEKSPEENRRNYVALTRAKNSEYIIVASTQKQPTLVRNYEEALERIENEAKNRQFSFLTDVVDTPKQEPATPQFSANEIASNPIFAAIANIQTTEDKEDDEVLPPL